MLKTRCGLWGRVVLVAMAWGGVACAGDVPPATLPPPLPAASAAGAAAGLMAPIKALIGDGACDTTAQCRTIGIGSKACGGPEGYLAWSSRRSDETALRAAVAAHAAARKEENLRSGMMSTCAVEPDPGASCQVGRCALRPRGLGGSSSAE